MELFRQQALESHCARLQGEVVLAPPRVGLWMTLGLVAVVALASVALSTASYARKEVVAGYVTPSTGMVRIVPPAAGTVVEILAAEGTRVEKGDPLLLVRHRMPSGEGADPTAVTLDALARQGEAVERRIALLGKSLAAEEASHEALMHALERERAALAERLARQREMAGLALAAHERALTLHERGVLAAPALDRAAAEAVAEKRETARLVQESAALDGRIEAERRALALAWIEIERAVTALEAERLDLGRQRAETKARDATLVVAPVAGTVAALTVAPGQDVTPERAPMQILPAGGTLEAALLVPSRAIGFIRPGQPVRIRYDAFPYARFGSFEGSVRAVTHTVLSPADAPAPIALAEPAYRVTVALARQDVPTADAAVPLRAGMLLEASVTLERRTLLAWLLAPLASLEGVLS